jgi:hypothetical protein
LGSGLEPGGKTGTKLSMWLFRECFKKALLSHRQVESMISRSEVKLFWTLMALVDREKKMKIYAEEQSPHMRGRVALFCFLAEVGTQNHHSIEFASSLRVAQFFLSLYPLSTILAA